MKNIRLIVCFALWSCVHINASDGEASFVYEKEKIRIHMWLKIHIIE